MNMCLITFICLSVILIHSAVTTELENRVFGGEEFSPYEHIYLVSLKVNYFRSNNITWCSGSILSSRWIISAAHCFPNNLITVEVSQHFMKRLRRIGYASKSQIVKYPGYIQDDLSFINLEKDLALVKTEEPIVFSNLTRWIDLPRNFARAGDVGTLAGYGKWEFGNWSPRAGRVFLSRCKSPLASKLLCSHYEAQVCYGDSGGALVVNGVLAGVTSSIEHLQLMGSVYVDVFHNLDWITRVMSSN